MLIIRCLLTLCLIGGLWTVHKPAYQWHHRWGFQANRNDTLSLPGKLACRHKSHFPCINNVLFSHDAIFLFQQPTFPLLPQGFWTVWTVLPWDTDWIDRNVPSYNELVRTSYMKIDIPVRSQFCLSISKCDQGFHRLPTVCERAC